VSVFVSCMEFARNPTKTAENTGKMIIRFFFFSSVSNWAHRNEGRACWTTSVNKL
jgi:hypothetical protein